MLDGKINDPYKTHRIRALTIVNKKSKNLLLANVFF